MKLSFQKKQTATYLTCLPLTLLAVLGCGGSRDEKPNRSGESQGRQAQDEKGLAPVHGSRSQTGGQKGVPVQWRVLEKPTGTRVTIGNDVGYCTGSHRVPRISGVRQIDSSQAVTLTAYFAGRPPRGCKAGVETRISYVVHIRGGLNGRPLYDGSQSPPVKRWPKMKHG